MVFPRQREYSTGKAINYYPKSRTNFPYITMHNLQCKPEGGILCQYVKLLDNHMFKRHISEVQTQNLNKFPNIILTMIILWINKWFNRSCSYISLLLEAE